MRKNWNNRAVDGVSNKAGQASQQLNQTRRPNIVLILADDLGYGDLGCYNPDCRIPTPNIDLLSRRGIRFTDAHSASAVCTPSRYGLLTGRYCWRSPLKRKVLYSYEPPLIEPGRWTLASLLRTEGYQTGCIGKWHLGLGYTVKKGDTIDFNRPLPWSDADRTMEEKIDFSQPIWGGPLELGFDYFFGTSGCSTCQPPYAFIENERFVEAPSFYNDEFPYTGRPGMTARSWVHSEADPMFTRKAIKFIESYGRSDEPFFLYLAASAPHEPCVDTMVPEFARGRSEAGPRGDLIWLFDWMVGQIVQTLERNAQLETTLIFISSDNGALPGDRILGPEGRDVYRTYGHRSCGDWRGYKAHIWEGGHRVPLIATWPGLIPAGMVSTELVCLNDIIGTMAALFRHRLSERDAEDSVSMLPILLGSMSMSRESDLRTEVVHHSGAGVFSIRRQSWKLIHETLGSGGWPPPSGEGPEPGSPGQLYNLYEDPREERNVFEEETELVEDLMDQLRLTQESE